MQGARSSRRRYTEGQQGAVLDRFRSSGLSVREFCSREGVSASSLQRWRSRGKSVRGPRFVELTPPAVAASVAPEAWAVELELPGGLRVRLRG